MVWYDFFFVLSREDVEKKRGQTFQNSPQQKIKAFKIP